MIGLIQRTPKCLGKAIGLMRGALVLSVFGLVLTSCAHTRCEIPLHGQRAAYFLEFGPHFHNLRRMNVDGTFVLFRMQPPLWRTVWAQGTWRIDKEHMVLIDTPVGRRSFVSGPFCVLVRRQVRSSEISRLADEIRSKVDSVDGQGVVMNESWQELLSYHSTDTDGSVIIALKHDNTESNQFKDIPENYAVQKKDVLRLAEEMASFTKDQNRSLEDPSEKFSLASIGGRWFLVRAGDPSLRVSLPHVAEVYVKHGWAPLEDSSFDDFYSFVTDNGLHGLEVMVSEHAAEDLLSGGHTLPALRLGDRAKR